MGDAPALQFIFDGISVDAQTRVVRGYRVLESTERPQADTWLRHTYEWDGKRYVLRSTTRQKETRSRK